MRLYSMTKYSDLFKDTYWGGFDFELNSNNSHCTSKIIRNRNEFIEEFEIKKYVNKPPNYLMYGITKTPSCLQYFLKRGDQKRIKYLEDCTLINEFIDHPEVYKSDTHYYLIFSLNSFIDDKKVKLLEKNRWKKYKNLYSEDSETWLKINKIGEKINY